MSADRTLQVHIIVAGEPGEHYICGSLRFCVPDDAKGEGGGWVGVRPGHAAMLAALAPGEILLYEEPGSEPQRIPCGRGFLTVKNDEISIITG